MAGFTKEQIYNIVLNNLGVTAIVQNATEVTARITALNNYYNIALEQVMKDYDWNFLSYINYLTPRIEESPNPKFRYCYDYPNDCIAIRKIIDSFGGDYHKCDICTSKSGDRMIVCNIPNAKIRYTRKRDIQNSEAFITSEFVISLAFYLAFLSAEAIVGNSQKQQVMYQAYQQSLSKAKVMDANESEHYDEDETTYVDSRN